MTRSRKTLVIGVVLFAVAFAIGTYAVRAFRGAGGVQGFYQPEFGPAVLLACGAGYRSPDVAKLPQLAAFLRLEQNDFDCTSLPGHVPVLPAFSSFAHVSRYLLVSVAETWRVVGVSWSRLAVFGGVFFAIVASLTYAIVSISVGPVWGLAATAPLLWSPMAFAMVPHFRDYAKAAFMLAMLLAMALLVTGSGRPARVCWLAAAGGVIAGIGLGFRNDLLIAIPPFVIVLLALAPVQAARPWMVRTAATGIFLVTFGIVAAPVLADYSQGSNSWHVALLGFMTPFDRVLGVQGSVYDLGAAYDDSLAYRTIDSFSTRVEHRDVAIGTAEYDAAGLAFVRELVMTTPADVVTRVLGAMREVPVFVLNGYVSPPIWVRSSALRWLYDLRAFVDVRLARLAPLAVACVVLLAAGQSIRLAAFLLLILAVFAGGAAVQFHERHFFYLEFVPWWAFACLCRLGVAAARKRGAGSWRPDVDRAAIMRAGACAAACLLTGVAVVGSLRAFQQRKLRALFDGYLSAPRQALAIDGWRPGQLGTTFVVAELGGDRCDAEVVAVTMHGPWKRTIEARIDRRSQEPTHVFFAAYDLRSGDEAPGVTVPAAAQSCLAGVARVDTSSFPLLFNATLAPGWRSAWLHQRLAGLW